MYSETGSMFPSQKLLLDKVSYRPIILYLKHSGLSFVGKLEKKEGAKMWRKGNSVSGVLKGIPPLFCSYFWFFGVFLDFCFCFVFFPSSIQIVICTYGEKVPICRKKIKINLKPNIILKSKSIINILHIKSKFGVSLHHIM